MDGLDDGAEDGAEDGVSLGGAAEKPITFLSSPHSMPGIVGLGLGPAQWPAQA